MVSSSNPSLSQSRRGLAPEFSKGKTRKIPWPLRRGGRFGVCPQTRLGDKTASRTNAVRRMFRERFTKKLYQTAVGTPEASRKCVLSKIVWGGPTAIQSAMLRRSKRGSSTAQRYAQDPAKWPDRREVSVRLAKRARYIVPLLWATVPSSTGLKPLSYTKREQTRNVRRNRRPVRFSERLLEKVARGLPAPPAI